MSDHRCQHCRFAKFALISRICFPDRLLAASPHPHLFCVNPVSFPDGWLGFFRGGAGALGKEPHGLRGRLCGPGGSVLRPAVSLVLRVRGVLAGESSTTWSPAIENSLAPVVLNVAPIVLVWGRGCDCFLLNAISPCVVFFVSGLCEVGPEIFACVLLHEFVCVCFLRRMR